VNGDGVTMIAHFADDSWNVDAMVHYAGHIGGRGHSGHAGRARDHNPAFRSRGHDHSCVSRDQCHCRVGGHGRTLSCSYSPFCRARNSVSRVACRHGNNRLLFVHPSQNERGRARLGRARLCGEDDVHADGKSYRRVGASGAVVIFEENVDAFLKEGDLAGPQSRAWVEVEE